MYGYVTILDEGAEITLEFSGRNQNNEERINLTITRPVEL